MIKTNRVENVDIMNNSASNSVSNATHNSMVYSQGYQGLHMGIPMNSQNSPTMTYQQSGMYAPPPPQSPVFPLMYTSPPSWASEIINDIKAIKSSLPKIENIEKTVNIINLNVSEMEVKIKTLETKVTEVESACSFISNESDRQKSELKEAKTEVTRLQRECQKLQESVKKHESDKENITEKLIDLESRSMRDNLLFYGIPEEEDENCVK
jgi:prefoldin subunit 5